MASKLLYIDHAETGIVIILEMTEVNAANQYVSDDCFVNENAVLLQVCRTKRHKQRCV